MIPPSSAPPSYGPSEPYPLATPPSVKEAPPNWGKAIAAGLLVTIAAGIIWGLISALTGYIFGLAGVFLGLAIAYAVRWGAKRITIPVIILAIALTFVAVFLGDVMGLTIALSMEGYNVGVADVIAHYPDLIAIAPLDVLPVYVFGLFGAVAGASSLLQAKKAATYQRIYSTVAPAPQPEAGPIEPPKLEVLTNTMTKSVARITVPMAPPHTIVASVESLLGGASVELDGTPFEKVRIFGPEKVVQVPLDGTPPHVLNIRFWGTVRPRIDFRLDGRLVGQV